MKLYFLALIAVLAITMCVAPQAPAGPGPDIGAEAPEEPEVQQPVDENVYCGLSVLLASPSRNEQVSGGFRAEWTLVNGTGSFVNKEVNFTIYMKTRPGGGTTDLRKLQRYFGEIYKEDITFLSPVPKGDYTVGVRGTVEDGCTVHPGEADIVVG